MIAKDIMTPAVVTISPGASLTDAAQMLVEHGISSMPVCDDTGAVVGIISERDLLQVSDRSDAGSTPVEVVMTCPAVVAREETTVNDLIGIFRHKSFRRVPVIREGEAVGIVSRRDVLLTMLKTPV